MQSPRKLGAGKAPKRSKAHAPKASGPVGVERAPARGKYDRSESPQERRRAQRARLFAAATRVFADHGFAKATVDDICVVAGVSRRTFYEHFDDLRDVLKKLHERLSNQTFNVVEQYVSAHAGPKARTQAGVEAILGLIANFPAEAKVVFRELRAAGPDLEPRREALLGKFATLLREGVQLAYDDGSFTLPPDEIRVYALVAAIEAVGMRYVDGGDHTRAMDAAPALIDMVLRTFA